MEHRKREESDWAFHAPNSAVFEALARGQHSRSLRELFGTQAFEELSVLAQAATQAERAAGPRVLVIPGMMGSRLCDMKRARTRVLWIDPRCIAAGRLKDLVLPSAKSIRPRGVLLPSYAKLKLKLAIEGFDAKFFAYDWRLGIDDIGKALASAIAAQRRPVILIAHSMGALAARIAAQLLPKRSVRRLIMIGAPNRGSFAPVLALRGTYPFVQKLSRLDLKHSADELAAAVFSTFPGLYQMLPPRPADLAFDLFDPACWPSAGPKPDAKLLARVAQARAGMAEPDPRMAQIVGINRDTIVSVRRTPAGFEYGSTRHGDGTVPVTMARLPGLKTYYADESHGNLANNSQIIGAIIDLARGSSTRELAQRFAPPPAVESSTDDEELLRSVCRDKIDWRVLDSAQREAILADLDGAEGEACSASAPSLA
jgi:hypothetical protein